LEEEYDDGSRKKSEVALVITLHTRQRIYECADVPLKTNAIRVYLRAQRLSSLMRLIFVSRTSIHGLMANTCPCSASSITCNSSNESVVAC
jgi:hypothetical protein